MTLLLQRGGTRFPGRRRTVRYATMASPFKLRAAVPADTPALFSLVNAAYHAESGDVAPGFKNTLRFLSADDGLSQSVADGRVVVAVDDGGILGLLTFEPVVDSAGTKRMHFGPFATATRARGTGVGAALLAELRNVAAAAGARSLDAEVVNHRYDLFPMYLSPKLGFRVVGSGAFPAPERTSRPCHFVCIRKALE